MLYIICEEYGLFTNSFVIFEIINEVVISLLFIRVNLYDFGVILSLLFLSIYLIISFVIV